MTTQQYLTTLRTLSQQLTPWQTRFAEIGDILALQSSFEQKIARFDTEAQQLNIAIMGQVKAGKSSFLNALLFNGRPVLPTAATPKTANLTRISYGATPALEVEYYSPDEWQHLRELAQQPSDLDTVRVARELVDMVEKANINVQQILTQGVQRIEANSLDDLMGKLNQYAGNDGQYTALVKMTRLYLPIEDLKGFDVIDTPGMNDPVLSRTQKTKEEMTRCDVVFFLSRAGQFLDQSDMDLLANQLPSSGVKRMILVAGQYDAAILDDGFNRSSLADTETNLNMRLKRRAETEMGKLAEQREQAGRSENAELLRQLTHPVLSSTFTHGFAHWPQDTWSDAMQHVHGELVEMAEDEWNGYQFSPTDWQRIANFDLLQQAYQQAQQDKQLLLQQQQAGLLPEAQQQLADRLAQLQSVVEQRIVILESQDLAQLSQQEQACKQQLDRIAGKLSAVISQQLDAVKQNQREIVQQLKQSMREHENLQTRTGTETEEEEYTVTRESSGKRFFRKVTLGLYDGREQETRYRTVSVSYEYLSASDAIEQLNQYARDCQYDIESAFNRLVSANQLKHALRSTLLDAMNTQSADYNPAQFRSMLERAVDQLVLPELHLDASDHTQALSQQFRGEIRSSSQMQQLKQQFESALHGVFKQLRQDFELATTQLTTQLTKIQRSLQSELTRSIEEDLQRIRNDFKQKQQALEEYNQLKQCINT